MIVVGCRSMTEARDVRELIADRVRRRRHQMRLTQEELAREAWRVGRPSVTRSVIAAVERGTAHLTLTELGGLLRALDTNLDELLRSGGNVFLDRGVAIDVNDIVDQIGGRPTSWRLTTDSDARIVAGRHGIVAGYMQPPISPVEIKAGQKLGVIPEEVRRAAGALWERSLDEERDARLRAQATEGASARTIQALRGHITRSLLLELEPTLKRKTTPKPRSRGKT
jgi:transcriptional regulator with XRE-family HTH domain